MANDTKETVLKAFLLLVSKEEPVTAVAISKSSGVTRPTITANFGKELIKGIIYYLFERIDREIYESLQLHNPNELPPEIFFDIVFSKLYENRDELRILFTKSFAFQYDFAQIDIQMKHLFDWEKERFSKIIQSTPLDPFFSTIDLFKYWDRWLTSVIVIWLSSNLPDEPKVFKKKFMFLLNCSFGELFYPEFKKKNKE